MKEPSYCTIVETSREYQLGTNGEVFRVLLKGRPIHPMDDLNTNKDIPIHVISSTVIGNHTAIECRILTNNPKIYLSKEEVEFGAK